MSEFSKAYCNLHPHQLITNFCTKNQCLVPLCANCICTHTQQHIDEQTAPIYQNIRSTYKNIHEQLRGKIDHLDSLKNRIGKIKMKTYDKRSFLKEAVMKARESSHQFIDEYFDKRCQDLLKEIEATERKTGLQCEARLESLENSLTRETSTLVNASQDASFDGFIEALPRLRGVILENCSKLIEQVERQVKDNQTFSTKIQFNGEQIKNIAKNLVPLIKMTVSLPTNALHASEIMNIETNMKKSEIMNNENAFRIPHKMQQGAPERGYSVDEVRNRKAQNLPINFMKIPENKPIKNQVPPQSSLKPQQQAYYGPNYYQNTTKNYQSYLNQIPIQNNLPSAQYPQNQNSAVKISMNPNLHKKSVNTLSHDYLLNNRLSASRVQKPIMNENDYIPENPQKSSMIEGDRKQFMKVSLSKKPKKTGLKIINHQFTEGDQDSYNVSLKNSKQLRQSKADAHYY